TTQKTTQPKNPTTQNNNNSRMEVSTLENLKLHASRGVNSATIVDQNEILSDEIVDNRLWNYLRETL
ncbi:MAG: hypothetical protein OXI96_04355, partial [Acidimicrobiaceae bacterium]|nr:hypothetical protein [Acidimicrobiaceae bacterium]